MTYHDEAITLKYLLTKLLQRSKVAVEHIHDSDPSLWITAWNDVKDLRTAIYAVVEQIDIDYYKNNGETFKRISDMHSNLFYLAGDGERYPEATLELIDLMLNPVRIAETVTYILHGDI